MSENPCVQIAIKRPKYKKHNHIVIELYSLQLKHKGEMIYLM